MWEFTPTNPFIIQMGFSSLRSDFDKFRKKSVRDYDALIDFSQRLAIRLDEMVVAERKLYEESYDRLKTEVEFLRGELKEKNMIINSLINNGPRAESKKPNFQPVSRNSAQDTIYGDSYIKKNTEFRSCATGSHADSKSPDSALKQSDSSIKNYSAAVKKRPAVDITENHVNNNRIAFKPSHPITSSPSSAAPIATTPATNDTTAIVTDSHGARIKGRELSRHIDGVAYVTSIAGAKAEDMPTYVLPSLKKNARRVIIHAGCNDILQSNGDGAFDPTTVVEPLLRSVKVCKDAGVEKVFISSLLPMKDSMLNNYVNQVNRVLYDESLKNMFVLIRNDNISIKLLHDNIHFNNFGRDRLANNFINYINENFLY